MATVVLFLLVLDLQNVNSYSTTCSMSKSVVHDLDIDINLNNSGWINCYSAPMSDHTSITTLQSNCKTGDNYYLFVGATKNSSSVDMYIGAYAPSQVLTTITTSKSTAYKPKIYQNDTNYTVYWYNYRSYSFGFAASSRIALSHFDRYDNTNNDRLSWEVDRRPCTYRIGSLLFHDSMTWQKKVYFKKCPPITEAPITEAPTNNPSSTATTDMPTQSPTSVYNDLLFICYYNDRNAEEWRSIITKTIKYGQIMVNQTISTIEYVSQYSSNYDDEQINSIREWRRSGITFFKMCTIFNQKLVSDCPEYVIDTNIMTDYVGIASFGIVVESALDEYQKYIKNAIESDEFRNEFIKKMNDALNKLSEKQNSFDSIYIEVVDTKNSTYNAIQGKVENADNDRNKWIYMGVGLTVFGLILIILMAYCCWKLKNRNKTQNEGRIASDVEMNVLLDTRTNF